MNQNHNHIDLHIHTVASDGLHTPSEVVLLARQKGLRIIAISDHDTVDGIDEAIRAAAGSDLVVIPGVEISTDAEGLEIHVLGYWVDHTSAELSRELAHFRESRRERGQRMLAKLRALGVHLSWGRVRELAGDGSVGRPHIALAMQEAGYVGSSQEAFDRYLGRNRPAYVERDKVTPAEAIKLVRNARGVPVLAHPASVASAVPQLAAEGLAGLEVYYAGYLPEVVNVLRGMARQYGLICTGGSDFHGLDLLPENRLGEVYVPDECAVALEERRRVQT